MVVLVRPPRCQTPVGNRIPLRSKLFGFDTTAVGADVCDLGSPVARKRSLGSFITASTVTKPIDYSWKNRFANRLRLFPNQARLNLIARAA
jgi:hypothetical protein